MGHGGILAIPDLLAPSTRQNSDDTRFIQDYEYSRDRPRGQSSSLFDTTSFNVVSMEYVPHIFWRFKTRLPNSINFIAFSHC